MFTPKSLFTGFSVDDISKAKAFYTDTLGLIVEESVGGMYIRMPDGTSVWMYQRADHEPATYTMLNFVVDHIDEAADELIKRGVQFERYEGMPADDRGIMRGKDVHKGPNIAWFKDPAGNILSVIEKAE